MPHLATRIQPALEVEAGGQPGSSVVPPLACRVRRATMAEGARRALISPVRLLLRVSLSLTTFSPVDRYEVRSGEAAGELTSVEGEVDGAIDRPSWCGVQGRDVDDPGGRVHARLRQCRHTPA